MERLIRGYLASDSKYLFFPHRRASTAQAMAERTSSPLLSKAIHHGWGANPANPTMNIISRPDEALDKLCGNCGKDPLAWIYTERFCRFASAARNT